MPRNADLADKICITIGSSGYDELENGQKRIFCEYYDYMKTADILVGYSFPTENIASYAPNLRWIHFISSGVEHVSPFTWVPKGMKLINNRGVHLPKSGESFATFLGMLNSGHAAPYDRAAQSQMGQSLHHSHQGQKACCIWRRKPGGRDGKARQGDGAVCNRYRPLL